MEAALNEGRLPKRPKEFGDPQNNYNAMWNLFIRCWNRDQATRPNAEEVLACLRDDIEPPRGQVVIRNQYERYERRMSMIEVLARLLRHGCVDLSSRMDPKQETAAIISGGGFGDIWLGTLYNGAKVAIKAQRASISERSGDIQLEDAARGAYIWSKVKYENIHELMGIMVFRGYCLGMVSEWMENGNMRQYIAKHPYADRHKLCAQTASAVAYLHEYGIVHGDIEPHNLLVSSNGVAKLTGFVSSIMPGGSLAFPEITSSRIVPLRWAVPELLSEEATNSKPADVYALGMTIFEILNRTLPYYESQSHVQVMNKITQGVLPTRPVDHFKNDERGNMTWELLVSCWNRDPAARPTASQVLGSLNEIAAFHA